MLFDTFTYPPKELVVLINWFKDQGLNLSTAEILPFAKFQHRLTETCRWIAEQCEDIEISEGIVLNIHRCFQEAIPEYLSIEEKRRQRHIASHFHLLIDSSLLEFLFDDPFKEKANNPLPSLRIEIDLKAIFLSMNQGMSLKDIFYGQTIFLVSDSSTCDRPCALDSLADWIFGSLPSDFGEYELDFLDMVKSNSTPRDSNQEIYSLRNYSLSDTLPNPKQLYRRTAALTITARGLKESRLDWSRMDQKKSLELLTEFYLQSVYLKLYVNKSLSEQAISILIHVEEYLTRELELIQHQLDQIKLFLCAGNLPQYDEELTFIPEEFGLNKSGLQKSKQALRSKRVLYKMLLRAYRNNYRHLRSWTESKLRILQSASPS